MPASVSFGDLGQFLRTRWEDFPTGRASYLVADEPRAASIRAAFRARGRMTCGVAWLSRAVRIGSQKSIPLAALAPILRLRGLVGVNLQYGDTKDDHAALAAAGGGTLVQAVGVELAAHNVQVNAIAQNFVDNPTYFPTSLQANPKFQERLKREVPLGRLVAAREDALFAAMLCSPDIGCFVGQVFPVCGGWVPR